METITQWIKLLIILSSLATVAQAQGMCSTQLDKYEFCPETTQEVIFFVRPINANRGQQLIDFNLTIPYAIAENMLVKMQLEKEAPMVKNVWVHLVNFEVKQGVCVALDKYMGELAYDMERAVGLAPRTCPLPKGTYHANGYKIDFCKLRLPIMPTGTTRVKIELYHKQRKRLVTCVLITLSAV